MKRTKRQKLNCDCYHRYKRMYGNYKSDKWKSNILQRAEVKDLIVLGDFSKEELTEIRNFVLERAFTSKKLGMNIGR